jgi:hypothetical protein
MTKLDRILSKEGELLRWVHGYLYRTPRTTVDGDSIIQAIGAFLADPPACDAEKAVLVKLVEEQAAERHRWGGHAADGFGKEWRNCQSVLCQKARDVLSDPSSAAAALLAQGRRRNE